MVPAPLVEPTLSAMMCDGMGWFSSADLKRVLLVFDEVRYLLPRETVVFADRGGESRAVLFPTSILTSEIVDVCHYSPDQERLEMLLAAARVDAADATIREVVQSIPAQDRLYTRRVVNSDPDLGRGTSLGLSADQEVEAHLIALNPFSSRPTPADVFRFPGRTTSTASSPGNTARFGALTPQGKSHRPSRSTQL